MQQSLAGVKVLDLSRVLAGPWATQMLADLGADVIKVERPGLGDDTRSWGPPFAADGETAAYFLAANRGKRSIAIDLSVEEGRTLAQRLATNVDIVVENFRVGTARKMRLDYESLRRSNPNLIYVSITGFGQDGPRSSEGGYDAMIQAMGGMMSVTGVEGGEPVKVGVAIADLTTGFYASIAILAALQERSRTGRGQYIDLALFDCQLALLANQAMNYLVGGQTPAPLGSAHPNLVPYQAFTCGDGQGLMLAIGNDRQFATWCRCAGREAWAQDSRFARNRDRVANRDTLITQMADVFTRYPRAEWLALLGAAGVPAGPVNDVPQAFADPQARARGMVASFSDERLGALESPSNPLIRGETVKASPHLGQHTNAILAELGLNPATIQEMRERGVVG